MNSKQIAILISFLVGLPLFVYTLSAVDITRVKRIGSTIKPLYLFGYLVFSLSTLITYTVVWRLFLTSYNNDFQIAPLKLFNYRMIGFAISYVTPGPRFGGEITRGSLVSTDTSVSQKTGTIAAAMEMLSIFLAGILFDTTIVIIGLLLLPKSWLLQVTLLILLGITLLAVGAWYGFVYRNEGYKIVRYLSGFLQLPDNIIESNDHDPQTYVKNHTSALLMGVLLCLLTKLFIAAQMYILLYGLGVPITFLQAFLLTATIDIAYSIPSYMGLGALEAGQSGVLSLIGGVGAASAGVVVAFITRIRDIIFSGYGLLALTYYTSNGVEAESVKSE